MKNKTNSIIMVVLSLILLMLAIIFMNLYSLFHFVTDIVELFTGTINNAIYCIQLLIALISLIIKVTSVLLFFLQLNCIDIDFASNFNFQLILNNNVLKHYMLDLKDINLSSYVEKFISVSKNIFNTSIDLSFFNYHTSITIGTLFTAPIIGYSLYKAAKYYSSYAGIQRLNDPNNTLLNGRFNKNTTLIMSTDRIEWLGLVNGTDSINRNFDLGTDTYKNDSYVDDAHLIGFCGSNRQISSNTGKKINLIALEEYNKFLNNFESFEKSHIYDYLTCTHSMNLYYISGTKRYITPNTIFNQLFTNNFNPNFSFVHWSTMPKNPEKDYFFTLQHQFKAHHSYISDTINQLVCTKAFDNLQKIVLFNDTNTLFRDSVFNTILGNVFYNSASFSYYTNLDIATLTLRTLRTSTFKSILDSNFIQPEDNPHCTAIFKYSYLDDTFNRQHIIKKLCIPSQYLEYVKKLYTNLMSDIGLLIDTKDPSCPYSTDFSDQDRYHLNLDTPIFTLVFNNGTIESDSNIGGCFDTYVDTVMIPNMNSISKKLNEAIEKIQCFHVETNSLTAYMLSTIKPHLLERARKENLPLEDLNKIAILYTRLIQHFKAKTNVELNLIEYQMHWLQQMHYKTIDRFREAEKFYGDVANLIVNQKKYTDKYIMNNSDYYYNTLLNGKHNIFPYDNRVLEREGFKEFKRIFNEYRNGGFSSLQKKYSAGQIDRIYNRFHYIMNNIYYPEEYYYWYNTISVPTFEKDGNLMDVLKTAARIRGRTIDECISYYSIMNQSMLRMYPIVHPLHTKEFYVPEWNCRNFVHFIHMEKYARIDQIKKSVLEYNELYGTRYNDAKLLVPPIHLPDVRPVPELIVERDHKIISFIKRGIVEPEVSTIGQLRMFKKGTFIKSLNDMYEDELNSILGVDIANYYAKQFDFQAVESEKILPINNKTFEVDLQTIEEDTFVSRGDKALLNKLCPDGSVPPIYNLKKNTKMFVPQDYWVYSTKKDIGFTIPVQINRIQMPIEPVFINNRDNRSIPTIINNINTTISQADLNPNLIAQVNENATVHTVSESTTNQTNENTMDTAMGEDMADQIDENMVETMHGRDTIFDIIDALYDIYRSR